MSESIDPEADMEELSLEDDEDDEEHWNDVREAYNEDHL
jgi:hypothetical protein